MCRFTQQAKHNENFHSKTCEISPDDFFDWKITTLFYIGIHYVKALANQIDVNIGTSHGEIRGNIKPRGTDNRNPGMEFTRNAYGFYDHLYKSSQRSRYFGFVDSANSFTDHETFQAIMKIDHEMNVQALESLKKYIILSRKLKVDEEAA